VTHLACNRPARLFAFALTVAAVAGGCGDGDSSPETTPDTDAPATTTECGNVMVPGHEAVDIRAGGLDCEPAEAVAAAAEGRGRQPYEAEGFTCEPADAGDGDTDYTCTRGEAAVRFRYRTA